jgi:hypothetical protein
VRFRRDSGEVWTPRLDAPRKERFRVMLLPDDASRHLRAAPDTRRSDRRTRTPATRSVAVAVVGTVLLWIPLRLEATPAAAADRFTQADESPRLELRGLGVSMSPPADVAWRIELREDGRPRAFVARPVPSPAWTATVEPFEAGSELPEPAAIDEAIAYLRSLRESDAEFTILENRAMQLGDATGHLLLLEVPLPKASAVDSGDVASGSAITGFLIVPRGARSFLAVRISAETQRFPSSSRELLSMLESVRVRTLEDQAAWERSLLDGGRGRLASFARARLAAAADGDTRWFRVHRPATGEQPPREIGSLAIRAAPAPRGMLDPARDPESLRTAERESGVLLTVEGRMLPPETVAGESRERLDLSMRAWTSLDLDSEAWSLRQSIRDPDRRGAPPTIAETGIRSAPRPGQPRPVLEVVEASRESMSRTPQRWTLGGEPHLGQVESALLGALLAPVDAPVDLAWQHYDRNLGAVVRRLDEVRPLPDTDGEFLVRTLVHPDDPNPIVQRFDREGRLLKRVDADGTITESIEAEDLRRLWERRRLPLD